jgi:hypothetical protein
MSFRKVHTSDGPGATARGRRESRSPGATIALITLAAAVVTLGLTLVLLPDRDEVASARHGPPNTPTAGVVRQRRALSRPPAHPSTAVLTIPASASVTRVPRSFFGLSTEYWALPLYERHFPLFERALSLLRVQGDGPQILRIGGDSADHAFWDPRSWRMPWWAFRLTPALVRRVASLVRGVRVRLILDLNLITDSSASAADWARAAEARLPRGSIVGFEVGNEPDLYAHWYWLASIGRTRLAANVLPRALSPMVYSRDFRSYARVLRRIAPNVPLAGPALANPQRHLAWLMWLLSRPHAGLGIVSAHRYPYSACVRRTAHNYPTVARLLSDNASAGLARSVRSAVRLAHRARLPFRLTEVNSVTCGGLRGVSDTFATALWAPDALFELLRAGVDGVNVHMRANTINAPFALTRHGLVARPLMYGLLLFKRMLGRDSQLIPTRLRATRSPRLKAWSVRVGRTLHVLLIDKGDRSVRVRLRIPARGAATVERLLAPSAGARWGVTLAGQRLDGSGAWQGERVSETVAPTARGYLVTVPRLSAAFLAVRLRPGTSA